MSDHCIIPQIHLLLLEQLNISRYSFDSNTMFGKSAYVDGIVNVTH